MMQHLQQLHRLKMNQVMQHQLACRSNSARQHHKPPINSSTSSMAMVTSSEVYAAMAHPTLSPLMATAETLLNTSRKQMQMRPSILVTLSVTPQSMGFNLVEQIVQASLVSYLMMHRLSATA